MLLCYVLMFSVILKRLIAFTLAVGNKRAPEEEENEEDEALDVETDSVETENLTKELLDIRMEMQRYQQDRKQLQ